MPKHKQSDVAHYKLASQFSLFLKRLFGPSALFPETEKKQRKEQVTVGIEWLGKVGVRRAET